MIPQHPKAATTNLCINCQHHHDDGTNRFADRCYRPENPINPVNGEIIDTSCEHERDAHHRNTCGPAGIYFAPHINQKRSDDFNDWASRRLFRVVDEVVDEVLASLPTPLQERPE